MEVRVEDDVDSRRGEELRERGLEAGFRWDAPFNRRLGLKEKRGDFMLEDFSIERGKGEVEGE